LSSGAPCHRRNRRDNACLGSGVFERADQSGLASVKRSARREEAPSTSRARTSKRWLFVEPSATCSVRRTRSNFALLQQIIEDHADPSRSPSPPIRFAATDSAAPPSSSSALMSST
jgi:hypothetical protein